MNIKDRIKYIFSKSSNLPLVETKQRISLPDGFIGDYLNVCAVCLKKGNIKSGVRLYSYKTSGNCLQKEFIMDMDEAEWQKFQSELKEAENRGYIEGARIDIPSSLCEGKRGFYALEIKKYKNDNFKKVGVNIYCTDEKLRNIYVRSMSEKKWNSFLEYIKEARKEEKNKHGSFAQFGGFEIK